MRIETPSGAIKGLTKDGVHRFLGIRYAHAPVGERRWQPPDPVESWDGVLDATEFGRWCGQFDYERRDEGDVHSGEGWSIFHNVPSNSESGEDCLSLNVWAPAWEPVNAPTLKPVMVFLHGNALGSSFPAFDGQSFAKNGIVFVSINFRLHTMGIFAHPALTKAADPDAPLGRYSELDRLQALRWVQKNIAAFGGDPNHVTLAGQSEGGSATLQILTNPDAKGLFHQAIVQSGNGWWDPVTHAQHEQLGCMLATLANLDGCNATVEQLKRLHWSDIPATGPYTIDGRYWKTGATQAIDAGDFMDVPLLIGWNDFDGSSLRYSPQQVIDNTHPDVLAAYDTQRPVEDLAYALYTDLHSGAPARWAAHQMEAGAPVYLYLFSHVTWWQRGDVRGAEHGYELPLVFNSWNEVLGSALSYLLLDDDDRTATELVHSCWVSFVKTGQPECTGAPTWPRYRRATDQLMELKIDPEVRTGHRAAQLHAQENHKAHYLEQAQRSIEQLLVHGVAGEQNSERIE